MRHCFIVAGLLVVTFPINVGFASAADGNEEARAHYRAAQKFERQKDYDNALKAYSRAIKADPKFIDAYFSRSGLYATHKRDYRRAEGDLTKILIIDPNYVSARFNRALYREYLREYDKAIRDYTRIFDEETDFSRVNDRKQMLAHAYHYRGRAFQWYKHDFRRAIADYSKSLQLDPTVASVYDRRARVLAAVGEFQAAKKDFVQSLKRNRRAASVVPFAWLLATAPQSEVRDGKLAVQLAIAANRRWRNRSDHVLEVLSAAYAEAGEFEQAVNTQRLAIAAFRSTAKDRKATSVRDPFGASLGISRTQPITTRLREMQARFSDYKAGKPFHQPVVARKPRARTPVGVSSPPRR